MKTLPKSITKKLVCQDGCGSPLKFLLTQRFGHLYDGWLDGDIDELGMIPEGLDIRVECTTCDETINIPLDDVADLNETDIQTITQYVEDKLTQHIKQ